MKEKKTQFENDLAKAKITFKENKFKYKDNETNKIYVIDGPKYITDRNDYIKEKNINLNGYRNKIIEKKHTNESKLQKIDSLCISGYPPRKDMKDNTILEAIKLLGEALKQNKLEYLILVEFEVEPNINSDTVLSMRRDNKNCDSTDNIKYIYSMMNEIVNQIAISDHYNFIPGTKEDGKEHFEENVCSIRKEIDNKFLGQVDILEKLYKIVGELETFIKSYSIPGVNKRWRILNPNINNFDIVYDMIKDELELYNSIKSSEYSIQFSFYPSEGDIQKREIYFEKIVGEDKKNNLQYSYARIFQNEVITTLKEVMLYDFPELITK